jgi:hypothetical protein
MKLTGYAAIEYADKQGLRLNKKNDSVDEARNGLTLAEAEAVAADDPSLIWLEVDDPDYYNGLPTDFDPER